MSRLFAAAPVSRLLLLLGLPAALCTVTFVRGIRSVMIQTLACIAGILAVPDLVQVARANGERKWIENQIAGGHAVFFGG